MIFGFFEDFVIVPAVHAEARSEANVVST